MRQQTIDFEALESNATEAENKPTSLADSPAHPDYIRPDRQEIFAGKLHFEWPEPHHDRNTITSDRIHGSPEIGLSHRFTIKRGDTVKASYGKDKFAIGQVVGISHAKKEVRIRYPGSVGTPNWIRIAYVYPEPEPAPSTPNINEPAAISEVIETVNVANEPEGGFTDADIVLPTYSHDDFLGYLKLKEAGSVTFEDYQTHFKRLSNSQDEITAELKGRFNAKQLKGLAARLGDFYAKSNTKDKNASSVYHSMLSSFLLDGTISFAMGEDYTTAIINKVDAVTEADWNAHQKQQSENAQAEEKALSNPKNLEEFRKFIAHHGVDALTDEQMAHWDTLHADLERDRYAASSGPSKTVTAIDTETLGEAKFTLKEGYHQKRECKLWIVQLTDRVEKDVYKSLLGKARELGGWYSSFIKDQAGFQFLDADACLQFMNLLEGDVDRTDILENRKARKELTAADRLHELADSIIRRSEETVAASVDSLQNTARRADIQLGVRGRAHAEAALARSMHSVAEALSTGDAKYLDGIRHMTHLKTLDDLLKRAKSDRVDAVFKASGSRYSPEHEHEREKPICEEDIRYTKYPYPGVWKRTLEEAIEKCANKRGLKQVSARLKKRIDRESNEYFVFTQDHDIKQLLGYIERIKRTGYDTQYLDDGVSKYNRLQRADIRDIHTLRASLREYLPHRSATRGDDPATVAERELIGKKLPGFFPTPKNIIHCEMLSRANIEPYQKVLEPSCGKGDIVIAIQEEHPDAEITALEFNRSLADVLSAKAIEAEFVDFLQHQGFYDRIVMNPPFEQGADAVHVRHAYRCLKPGGRLVSIMCEGPFYRQDKKSTEFRAWFEQLEGESFELPEDAFNGADTFRQTGVRTRVVTIDRPTSSITYLTAYISLTENALPEITAESLHDMRWAIRNAIEDRGVAEVIGSGNAADQMDFGMEVADVELAKTQIRAIAAEFGLADLEFRS